MSYTIGEQIGALLIVILMGAAGGIIIGSLLGFKIPSIGKIFPGKKV